jgi:hypothetical protein
MCGFVSQSSTLILSVFVPKPCSFYCYDSVVLFLVRNCDASSIGLFAQNCFGYSRTFVFTYVFHDCFFNFCAECHWNFDRVCVEHVACFGSMAIFTILISTNPQAWKLFTYSDVFFKFTLQCFTALSFKRSLVSFVKFIPRYFIVFETIVNGIISLISLSLFVVVI